MLAGHWYKYAFDFFYAKKPLKAASFLFIHLSNSTLRARLSRFQ